MARNVDRAGAGMELALRRGDRSLWEVKLQGEGEHRIVVELRAALGAAAARKSLSLSIPEAASTAVDLEFANGESEIVVGANEVPSRTTGLAARQPI